MAAPRLFSDELSNDLWPTGPLLLVFPHLPGRPAGPDRGSLLPVCDPSVSPAGMAIHTPQLQLRDVPADVDADGDGDGAPDWDVLTGADADADGDVRTDGEAVAVAEALARAATGRAWWWSALP